MHMSVWEFVSDTKILGVRGVLVIPSINLAFGVQLIDALVHELDQAVSTGGGRSSYGAVHAGVNIKTEAGGGQQVAIGFCIEVGGSGGADTDVGFAFLNSQVSGGHIVDQFEFLAGADIGTVKSFLDRAALGNHNGILYRLDGGVLILVFSPDNKTVTGIGGTIDGWESKRWRRVPGHICRRQWQPAEV